MRMSISTTSGFSRRPCSTACRPSAASPTTSRSSSASRIILNPARTSAWSSAIRMRTLIRAPPCGRGRRRAASAASSSSAAAASRGPGSRRRAAARPPARRRRGSRARACRRARGRRPRPRRGGARPAAGSAISSRSSRVVPAHAAPRALPPPYLSAFVSASWTTRYAARSRPAGSARRSPSTCSSTGRPRPRERVDERAEAVERRLRGELARRPRRRAARRAGGASRPAPRGRCARSARPRRPRAAGSRSRIRRAPPACTTIDADAVRDDVVHLARDPAALVGDRARSASASAARRSAASCSSSVRRLRVRTARPASQNIGANAAGKMKSPTNVVGASATTAIAPTAITSPATRRAALGVRADGRRGTGSARGTAS